MRNWEEGKEEKRVEKLTPLMIHDLEDAIVYCTIKKGYREAAVVSIEIGKILKKLGLKMSNWNTIKNNFEMLEKLSNQLLKDFR